MDEDYGDDLTPDDEQSGEEYLLQDGPGLFDEPETMEAIDEQPDVSLADPVVDVEVAEPHEAEDGPAVEQSSSGDAPQQAPAAAQPSSAVAAETAAEAPDAPLALYRRYRPETFDEVIGQDHVTAPLKRALVNNRVNHAYLFSGPRGCGKTSSARILARALNCEQGPTPNPCGVCQSCRDLARGGGGSIDVIEIDAASHGGVEDARDLRERAFFAPVSSRYKIYIVDEAHMVTTAGFNAMLKLVEEPPPHVKFIFATTEPEKVIGTIRSRTHHYPFRLVPPKVLTGYLGELCESEGVAVDQAVLPLVVRAGAGSVRDSLSVLDQLLGGAAAEGVSYEHAASLLGFTPDSLLDEIMDAFAAGDSRGVFETIDKVVEVGQDPRRFAEDLLRRLRDLVIVAAVPDAISTGLIDVSGDQAERLGTQAAGMGPGELTRAAEVIAQGLTDMRGTTAPRLHLELMCSRVLLPGADVDDRGLHARLERLERRLADTGVPVSTATPAAPVAEQPRAQWPDQAPTSSAGAGAAPSEPQSVAQGQRSRPTSDESAADRPSPSTRPVDRPEDERDSTAQSGAGRPANDPGQPPGAPAGGAEPTSGPRDGAGDDAAHEPAAPQGATPSQRPAGQRPAGQRPPGQRPAGQRPAGQRPAGETGGDTEPPKAQPPAAAAGTVDVGRVRQEWPRVLEEVKSRRRYSWILLSQHAQVIDVAEGLLTLGFNNAGARDNFASGGSQDVLIDSMIEVLGAALRVNPIVDGTPRSHDEAAPGRGPAPRQEQSRGGHQGGPPFAPQASAEAAPEAPKERHLHAVKDPAPQQSHDDPPPDPADEEGEPPADRHQATPADRARPADSSGSAGPERPDDALPVATKPKVDTSGYVARAKQNIRPMSRSSPTEEPAPADDLAEADDIVVDDLSESAAELITRQLGGRIIRED